MKSEYLKQVEKGMDLFAAHPNTIFIGQAMNCLGHAVSRQVLNYPLEKRFEFPVAEDFQGGFSLGMALEGYIPICVYPRNDFAILALNQILNHIDRWKLMCPNSNPHIIIKTLVGAKKPLDGGHQHTANYIHAFKNMCQTIQVFDLSYPEIVYPTYEKILNEPGQYLINEYTELL